MTLLAIHSIPCRRCVISLAAEKAENCFLNLLRDEIKSCSVP